MTSRMTDPNPSAPKPPQNEPPSRETRPGRSRRSDRSPAQILIWVAGAAALMACFYFFMSDQHGGKEMPLGEFEQRVEDGSLNSKNVFELRFTQGAITFQDQPAKKTAKSGEASEESKPVQRTIVPTYMRGPEKEVELTKLLKSKSIVAYGYPS